MDKFAKVITNLKSSSITRKYISKKSFLFHIDKLCEYSSFYVLRQLLGKHLSLHEIKLRTPTNTTSPIRFKIYFFLFLSDNESEKISMNNKQIKDGYSSVCVWVIKIVICIVGDQQRRNSAGTRVGKADGNGEWKERFQTSPFFFILFGNMSINVGASRIINILRSVFFFVESLDLFAFVFCLLI